MCRNDDEPIALSIIQEYCKRFGDIELQCFTSPIEGMASIKDSCPDIVFLDIEMNSHNGVELAKELPKDICIIFTTAYSRYALDGFNVDAVDCPYSITGLSKRLKKRWYG